MKVYDQSQILVLIIVGLIILLLDLPSESSCCVCKDTASYALVKCGVCKSTVHVILCSKMETQRDENGTARTVCKNCVCDVCGSLKKENHVCTCSCCNDILVLKQKCSSCQKNVCAFSCCDKIPGENLYQRTDCQGQDPICHVCGIAGSELCKCLVCKNQIHSDECSVAEKAKMGKSSGRRVCKNCYCSECRQVKEDDHICLCKCCGSRPLEKKQCGRCRYYVCNNSCCKIIGSGELLCSDCVAAAMQLATQLVKDVVNMEQLSDGHMAKVAAIMQKQFGDKVEGLNPPLPVSSESLEFYPPATKTKPYIQIINTGRNHWVACLIKKGSSVLHIVDSNRVAGISGLTKIQAAMLLKTQDSCIVIECLFCMQQTNSVDCGLFAIAHALEFALNSTIQFCDFDLTSMRDHLYNCLLMNKFTEFPKLSSRRKKFKGHNNTDIVKVYCMCRLPENFSNMCQCDTCDKYFHYACVGVDSCVSEMTSWNCPDCVNK